MNVEISVLGVVELFKEIQVAPEKLFEMMRLYDFKAFDRPKDLP